MIILLFGVSNVGKSTVGKILAEKLCYDFYDLDDEIKKHYGITLEEFVNRGTLKERDNQRCALLKQLISQSSSNKVIAITPLSHLGSIKKLLLTKNALSIELQDSAENIFDRLVFSDENDVIYTDDEYKNSHRDYYLEDIMEDQSWYGNIYSDFCHPFNMNGDSPKTVADRIISDFNIQEK